MRVKFTKYEKVAGAFVLTAFIGSVTAFAAIAIKKGWLSPRESYHTHLSTAEGIAKGSIVQMSGLRVGEVTDIELINQGKIKVSFYVLSEFSPKIGDESYLMVFRPFVIGEKVLDIQASAESAQPVHPGSEIPAVASADIMDVLSGKKMGIVLGSMESLASSLRIVGEAFADGKRAKDFVRILDQMEPLVKNMNTMSQEVTKVTNVALKQRRLESVMEGMALVSKEMGEMIPVMKQESPDFALHMAQIVKNLDVLTTEFKKITPAISAVAPDLPRTSVRAVEALDEAVILLKAMQKSFLMRGNVKEVLEEEEKEKRLPASN